MKIQRISVPTPFKVGPVNVYLIEEDPLTLIDTGPFTGEAIAALRDGLSRLGHGLHAIKRVVLTHAHADHFGLARVVAEASGADVFVHEWDAPMVSGPDDRTVFKGLLASAGVPQEAIDRIDLGSGRYRKYEQRLDSVQTLKDQDEIVFDRESLVVVHTPGHTPGTLAALGDRRNVTRWNPPQAVIRLGHPLEPFGAVAPQLRDDVREHARRDVFNEMIDDDAYSLIEGPDLSDIVADAAYDAAFAVWREQDGADV